jgi:hypothetical protein
MSRLSDTQVIITVSHGSCEKEVQPALRCDRMAFLVGSAIRSELEKNKINPYFYANTDISRNEIDMNAKVSRNTHFRQSISKVIQYLSNQDNQVYAFDIHSFPKKGKYPIFLITHGVSEIIDQATSLASYLTIELGFKIGIYLIATECDIIEDIHSTMPSAFPILIEVNDNVTNLIISRLGKAIANWVFYKSTQPSPVEVDVPEVTEEVVPVKEVVVKATEL